MKFKEKNEFRKSRIWRNFSARFIKSKNRTCAICGIKTARMYVTHHQHKADYENLSRGRFLCLCYECHVYCHKRLSRLQVIAKNIKKFKWE